MNTSAAVTDREATRFAQRLAALLRIFERVPYSLLAIPLRLAVAEVFWNSGTTKLANWDATLQLFEDDYKVPLLPPDFAAHLGAAIELTTPVLLVLGLATRPAALVLLGMTTVIEVFVYPHGLADPYPVGGHAAGAAVPRRRHGFRSITGSGAASDRPEKRPSWHPRVSLRYP